MADTSNLSSFLRDVANSIRDKKGTTDKISAANFDQEILDIKSGELTSKDVDFIDYDGTLLYSYTLEEIQAMTELPPLPIQPGLICQEWNWSLEDIKAHNRKLIVGATYITDDGKTRVYIDLVSEERLEMSLCFRQSVSHGVEIDWGDGSPGETFNSTSSYILPTHEYEKIGKYVATFNPIGECVLTLGSGGNYSIIGAISSSDRTRYHYLNVITNIEIGRNVISIPDSIFRSLYNLSTVVIPNTVTNLRDSAFANCYNLSTVVIPNTTTSIGNYTFSNCYNLSTVVIPNTTTSIGISAFTACYSLPEIKIPSNVLSIGSQAFANCYSLKKIDFSEHTQVPVLESTNAFNYAPSDRIYIVPDALYDEWIAATNWSDYADYIVKASEVYMSILEEIMPTGETFDGLGGTEEEIESVADEILGNK